jgi:hypothetical protein
MIDMKKVEKAYKKQIDNCKNKFDALGNPVEMRMTLQQFADEWTQSGHWDQRGNKLGEYCMARHNDIGHYEVGNVKIILIEENLSEGNKGRPKSAEHASKVSAALKGKTAWNKGIPQSANHTANVSAALKGKPSPKSKIQCPHCGMWGGSNGITRWHGDNCKRKGEH